MRHTLDQRLVRGLDYYTATIFEIKTTAGELGAQNTICGGGRYDGLVASLGGPKTPAIGFALGVERTLLALTQPAESYERPVNAFFASMDAASLAYALPLAHRLRAAGISVEVEHRGGKPEIQLKRADKLRARVAVIIGGNEVASGNLTVKDLAKGTQFTVAGGRPRVQDPPAPRLTTLDGPVGLNEHFKNRPQDSRTMASRATFATRRKRAPSGPWLIEGGLCPPETCCRARSGTGSRRIPGGGPVGGAQPLPRSGARSRSAKRDGAPGCPGAPSTPTRPRNHPRVAWPPPGL